MVKAPRGFLAAATAAVLGVACYDATSPATWRAQLALVPVYEGAGTSATRDGTPTDIDSIVVILTNPPRTTPDTLVFRFAPGQDTIRIEVEVELDRIDDTVTVTFEAYNSFSGLLLYSGTQDVGVGPSIAIATRPMAVNYVGPGQNLAVVSVSPATASLPRSGTLQLLYDGFDNAMTLLPDDSVPVRYATSNRAVAEVTSAGVVQARGLGTAMVFVTALADAAIEDTAVITVADAPAPAMGLNPSSLAFQDTIGTADPPSQAVQVTNTGGGTLGGLAVGVIQYGAGGTGWLTAGLNGTTAPATLTVTAAKGALAAGTYTASVPVSGTGVTTQMVQVSFQVTQVATVASLVVSPGFAVLGQAQTQNLTPVARDALGNIMPTTGITYTSRNAGVATVNGAGQVTTFAEGTAIVVADLGGVRDSVLVVVAGTGYAVASAIGDTRAYDRVQPGDTVRVIVAVDLRFFGAHLLGSYNAQLDWTPARLTFVRTETVAGGFTAPVVNTTAVASGQLRFGAADANGHAGNVPVIRVVFVAGSAGTTSLALSLTDLTASGTFFNLLTNALVLSGQVRVQ